MNFIKITLGNFYTCWAGRHIDLKSPKTDKKGRPFLLKSVLNEPNRNLCLTPWALGQCLTDAIDRTA
jgi:hypothetical protein